MSVDHWMIFSTFAEQNHFEYPTTGAYRGVVINANMAAYAPAGIAAFLLEKTAPATQYLIDPLTHAFQHDPGLISDSNRRPKKSIRALAEGYGSPIADFVGEQPLLPEHFSDGDLLEGFVERTLSYQENQIARQMLESDAAKYMESNDELRPYALVAPYFFLTDATLDEWLPVNVRAAEIASNQRNNGRLFAEIVIDKGILISKSARERIIEQMSAIRLDGFLLWVDNLNETTAAEVELRGLVKLTRGLRGEHAREVINLHGGYFSVVAAGNLGSGAMTGVAHGPEFGEFRSVVPVGGGIPISRYYIPQLHARIRYRDTVSMLAQLNKLASAEAFHNGVCSCEECVETIGGNVENFTLFGEGTAKNVRRRHGLVRIQFPTTAAKLRSLRHYLQRKHREYLAASALDREALFRNLREGEQEYRAVAGSGGVAHLKRWRRVFADDE